MNQAPTRVKKEIYNNLLKFCKSDPNLYMQVLQLWPQITKIQAFQVMQVLQV